MTAAALLSLLAGVCTAVQATSPAAAAAASSHATLIAAGGAHSCMIQSGTAYCWGSNSNGQLGDGSTISSTSPVPVYTGGVLAGRTLTQIVAGASNTCALDSTGAAYCWGLNTSGQLGNNSSLTQSLVPVTVTTSGVLTGKTLTQLAAGNAHVCALDSTGTAYCWGSNGNGQLGINSTTKSPVPVAVTTGGVLSGVTLTQLAAGYGHTCAVSSTGAAYCWGANGNGQLGNSSTTPSLVPVAVTTSGVLSGLSLTQVSADQGGQYTCALASTGAAYCWGAASYGQLGNGASSTPGVPVAVSTSGVLSGVSLTQIATGSGTTCAVSSGGAGYCWGQDANGELGNNSTTSGTVPVAMTTSGLGSAETLTQVSLGTNFGCALDSANAVYCWGLNTSGQVGNPATGTHFLTPTPVTSQSTISAGYTHSCLIRNGRAYCWGDNSDGELGNNSTASSTVPVAVTTSGVLSGVILTQIVAGYFFTCALSSTGAVYCWGFNADGELGNNSTTNSSVPVPVSTSGVLSGTSITQITADSGYNACALGTNGAAYCWGRNSDGQLGNNTVTSSSVPVAVSTAGVLSGVTLTQISVGNDLACALGSTGLAYCWGLNSNGELGNNSTTNSSVPVAVATTGALSGVTLTQISVGNVFSCALGSTGAAYCWGYDASGQLGNGSTTSSSVAVAVTATGVLSGTTLTEVSAGASFTCALGGTGVPYCWGLDGSGQLGNSSTTTSSVPVAVTVTGALAGVRLAQVSAGNTNTCAVGSTGAYCWGANGLGQLGDGTSTQRTAPVQVIMLSPGPPTGVTATAADTTAAISWTAPATLGTGTLTGYTATAAPGGGSCSATTTSCTITGLTDGTAYSVTVVTRTTDGNSAPSTAVSAIPAACLTSAYSTAVAADSPILWYQLGDKPGTTAQDVSSVPHNGTYQGGVTLGVAGPTSCGTAAGFDGSTGYVSNANIVTSPATFSLEVWFNTTTSNGGLLAGFGSAVTGASGNYDRHIYMNNAGQIYFGVAANQTVHTTAAYNDGNWHQAVATIGPAGMMLYIDGALAASSASPTVSSQTYSGSWRVGYDSLGGWSSAPHSNFFAGSLAEVSVYGTQLSATRVAAHYAAASGVVTLPGAPAITAVSAADAAATLTWTAPASNGGGTITGYVVTPYIAGAAQAAQTFTGTATTESVTGLSPGTSYTFQVAAVNAAGTGPASAASVAVTPNAGPALTFAAPPAGEVSIAYRDALTATGGTGTLTWSVSAGTLPPGLTLGSSTGVLSGTPTAGGSYSVTVAVTDTTGQSATAAVTLVIAAIPSLSVPSPPSGQAGMAYSDPLTVTGGTGPFTWSVVSGSLPAGVTLGTASGTLSGTPTTTGLSSFTIQVTDADGLSATQSLNITIAIGPLVIAASADTTTATQGGTVHYTITITNTAVTAYSGVTFTVPLADVLDDATYNGNATATAGTVFYTNPNLAWTGNLAAGASATITFSVTVNNPYTGNGTLNLTVTSATAGTNCPAGGTDARCTVSIPVAALTIVQTAAMATAAPGSAVHFTVTVTNSGVTAYTGAAFTDPLTGMLDDAAYDGDAAATTGTASYASPNLTWTGNLAAGASATISFSVTVSNPDTGNQILTSTITSAAAGSNCPAGSLDARCTATVDVQGLTMTSSANVATATPGSIVQYTITVTNTGQASYSGASLTDPLTGVLDDASYDGDGTATGGSLSYTNPNLTWTGNLAVGASATITFSVTVNNPDTGNKVLASTITSTSAGSNCAGGSTDPRCASAVTVLVPGLTIAVSADTGAATPGSVVHYTVTVTNSGQTAYTGAAFTDPLSGLLDDAAYDGDASATAGTVSYASSALSWTGNLAVGAVATITFSVTVNNPDNGDKVLGQTVTSVTAGSNCVAGSTDARCSVTVVVLVPGLTIAQSANSGTTAPGSVVHYTVTVTNSGQTAYTGAAFTDPLGGVLDDAVYDGDASATAGTVSFASPVLAWTGALAPGAAATVTFSVTVSSPGSGNDILASTITSATAGSNCAAGSTDPRCSVTVDVAVLTIVASSDVSSATPGSVVRFTATFTNAGQVAYTGITIASDITGILDDATADGDQTATSGTLTVTATAVSWTGSIPVGGTVTITGTVTVDNPDLGNKLMTSAFSTAAAGSNCPAGGTDPRCSVSVTVLVPDLSIVKTANATFAVPGQVVGYTVTVTDTGQTPYAGAVVTDSLAGTADDAGYDGDAAATAGSLSYASPVLTWTGNLAPGAAAVITYTVTVNNPDTGDKLLINSVSSTATGSSCPPGSVAAACLVTVAVLTPALTIVTAAVTTSGSNAVATPGGVVTYTITVTNTGQVPYAGASLSDPLTGVLDDAAYNGDAAATAGTVSYASPVLSWTGDLAVGAAAVITYTVTVNNPDTGNRTLTGTVTSATTGSNCPAAGGDARCTVTVTIVGADSLTFTQTAAAASTVAGGTVQYTITAVNSAASPYTGASFTDPLGDVLDDAAYDNGATATAGTVSFASPVLSWSGTVPANGTVTITYTVTVNNPDTGNMILAATISSPSSGSNCPADSPGPRCTATVTVSALLIDFTASTATTTPGGVIGYTATLTNTGQTPYYGISVATDSTGISDDATGNGDQQASSGTLSIGATGAVWTGDIPVGATVTITSTATVDNPDTGDHILTATAVSAAPGSNCPAGGTDPVCTPVTTVLTPALTITQAAGTTAAVPGQTITYTLTIADTGQTTYAGAVVTDSFAQMLDDAAYDGDAAITTGTGTLSYTSPILTWTGTLAPGTSAVITYTITANNPDTGDKLVITTAASTATGSTCPPGTTTSRCQLTVPVLTPALTMTAAAAPAAATPGAVVTYTLTVTDTGQTAYTAASVTDPLTDVLDDAAYNHDAHATAGTVTYASPALTWTGDLTPGTAAVITFSVTVHNPDTDNHILASTITSAAAGSNCPPGSTDPRCTATVPVSDLVIDFAASASTVTPGGSLTYTATITNAGQTPYFGISVSTGTVALAANTTSDGNTIASSGTLSIGATGAVWTGDIPVGGTVTIISPVIVDNPVTSDVLTATAVSTAPGNNCPPGSTDPRCTPVTQVLFPALTITKTAAASTTTPGSAVSYTITVTDTGPTPYTAATVTDALDGVLPDAAYDNDATATTGTLTYTSPDLTWTGDLTPGATAVITYTVTLANPDTGDKHLVNTATSDDPGSTCPAGTANPACTATVTDLIPALTVTKTANASTATPGSAVGYTITVADTGQTPYTAAPSPTTSPASWPTPPTTTTRPPAPAPPATPARS